MNEFEVRQHICMISEMQRIEQGKTVKQWCEMIGTTESSYRRSMNLEKNKFDLFKVIRLAEVTGLSIDDICGRTDRETHLNNYQREMTEAVFNYVMELKERKK